MISPRQQQLVIMVFVFLLLMSTTGSIYLASRKHRTTTGVAPNEIQCGHWCLLRVLQFHGAPLSMNKLLELLPPNENGHSFAQLKDQLENWGFDVVARKENIIELSKIGSPVILKLNNPDHFVVAFGKMSGGALIYDGSGKRRIVTEEVLAKRWSGYLLEVNRPVQFVFDPQNRDLDSPAIQFQYIRLDKGDFDARLPGNDRAIYSYPFTNVGQMPLKIENISVDCKCLEATISMTEILPGESGQIELKYSSGATNRHGVFEHSAIIETNDPSYPFIALTAAGNSDYRVRVEPQYIDFGNVTLGEQATRYIYVSFWGDDPSSESVLDIEFPTTDFVSHQMTLGEFEQQDLIAFAITEGRFERNNVSVIKVVFQPNEIRKYSGRVKIRTNTVGLEEFNLPFIANVEDSIHVSSAVVDLTSFSNTDTRTCAIQLKSKDSRTISIERVASLTETTGLNIQFPNGFAQSAELAISCDHDLAKSLHGSEIQILIRLGDGTSYTKSFRIACWE